MKKFKSIKALLTSGAGPGVSGIVNALKNHPFRDVQVVVGEVDDYECAGFMLADESCVLPRAGATDYLEEMSRICREFGIDVIVPAFSGELDALADAVDVFAANGTSVLLPSKNVVNVSNNKGVLFDCLKVRDVAVPGYERVRSISDLKASVEKLGYPHKTVCLKPVYGAGNRGFHIIVPDRDRFHSFFEAKPDNTLCTLSELVEALNDADERSLPELVVMEFLSGQEYGVDLLAKDGDVLAMKIRKKLPPEKLGMQFRMEFVKDQDVEKLVADSVRALSISSVVNVDVRRADDGKPCVVEINPRQSAYIGTSSAEINMMAMAIDMLLGESVHSDSYASGKKVDMGVRYFNDYVIYSDKSTNAF